MNDRAFRDPDVRQRMAEWGDLTRHLDELRREVEENAEIIGLVAAERDDLRRELARERARADAMCADLLRELAALRSKTGGTE